MRAHHQIAIKEVGRKGFVGPDAADVSSQMEHNIGRMLFEQPNRVSLRYQVVIAAAHGEHVVAAAVPAVVRRRGSQKAPAAGDHDPLAL